MKNWLKRNLVPAVVVGVICSTMLAWAASQGHFLGVVFLADPTTPTQQASVNALGQLSTSVAAATTGGDSVYSAPGGTGNALITNTAGGILVVSGAHSVHGWSFVNTGNATCYVQVFDLAAATVTLGTTVPKVPVWVPTAGAWEEKFPDEGVAFANGIVIAATTTATGSTGCNAAQQATIVYK